MVVSNYNVVPILCLGRYNRDRLRNRNSEKGPYTYVILIHSFIFNLSFFSFGPHNRVGIYTLHGPQNIVINERAS